MRVRNEGEEFTDEEREDHDIKSERTIIEGEWAEDTWSETDRTPKGDMWDNHGVDVYKVRDGMIDLLHENNDVRIVQRFFPRYEEA